MLLLFILFPFPFLFSVCLCVRMWIWLRKLQCNFQQRTFIMSNWCCIIIQVNFIYFFLLMNAKFKRQGCVDLSSSFVYPKQILNLYQCYVSCFWRPSDGHTVNPVGSIYQGIAMTDKRLHANIVALPSHFLVLCFISAKVCAFSSRGKWLICLAILYQILLFFLFYSASFISLRISIF